jgi:single-strand DNA-binding protein
MAEGLNRVMLLGNLGADPELRMTSGGQAVLKLRMATTENYLDKNRQRQERTEWHNVVIWGKRAEALAKILTKGTRIFVEGGLRTSSYEDRDGNKRYRTEVVSSNILLQGRSSGGGAPGGGGGTFRESAPEDSEGSEGYRSSGAPAGADFPETDDDDIPF